jgi:hypothetical protein
MKFEVFVQEKIENKIIRTYFIFKLNFVSRLYFQVDVHCILCHLQQNMQNFINCAIQLFLKRIIIMIRARL